MSSLPNLRECNDLNLAESPNDSEETMALKFNEQMRRKREQRERREREEREAQECAEHEAWEARERAERKEVRRGKVSAGRCV